MYVSLPGQGALSRHCLLPDIKFEVQQSGSGDIAFLRGAVAQSFAGASVEVARDAIAVGLGEVGHALTLGAILPEQPVGVLVGAPSPGAVWGGEVEAGAGERWSRFRTGHCR